MQFSRNHLFLILNVVVLFGCIALLLPKSDVQQLLVIAVAMAVSLVVPFLIIKQELASMSSTLAFKEQELSAATNELLEARRKVREAATLDELSGAFNRRHFEELLHQHCAIATRGDYVFSISSIKIDSFTDLVKKFGPEKGDEVMRLFVSVSKSSLREVDFIGRMEGEKFCLMLSGASEEFAILAVNRTADLIHQIHVSDDDPDFRLSTSAGVTEFRKSVTAESMLTHADKALGFAINEGGHRIAAHIHTEEVANP